MIELKTGDDVLKMLDTACDVKSVHALVHPDAARALLEINTRNRTILYNRVKTHVQSIRDGRWKLITDGIGIDWNGDLFNGQHRLLAIIEADTPCEVFFMTGLDPEGRLVTDVGRARTMTDQLQMNGYGAGRTHTAAALRLLYRLDHDLITTVNAFKSMAVPHDVLMDYLRTSINYEELNDAVNAAHMAAVSAGVNRSSYAAFMYMVRQIDGPASARFHEALVSGANLEKHDPILTLRGVLARLQEHRNNVWHLAMYAKTWNAWRAGRKMEYMAVRPDEKVQKLR